jgi:hypothetical protein
MANAMIKNVWIWDNFNFNKKDLKKDIKSLKKGSTFNLFAAEEYEIKFNDGSRAWNLLNEINFKKQDITVNVVFGSSNKEYYNSKYNDKSCINLWPTFFINRSAYHLKNYKIPNRTYKYLFISMNNLPRTHRCYLIDSIKKYNLDVGSAITWYHADVEYNWKHWKPTRLMLSDKKYINYHKSNQVDSLLVPSIHDVPLEFFQSYFSLVSESSVNHCFLTEKTAIPLLLEQPFIVQGARGFHNFLKLLGFELYDEIFDYSFDNLDCFVLRTDKIIENIQKLKSKNIDHLKDQIAKKAKRNRITALKISANKNLVPKLVLNNEYSKNIYSNELSFIKLN